MTRVESDRFGPLDVDEERFLSFPEGLPGFPGSHRFVLLDAAALDENDDEPTVFWLQSAEDPALAFLCAVPWPFFPEYAPSIPDGDQASLQLQAADDALVLCLLTVHRAEHRMSANLLGPIVVNRHTRVGRQVVLADADWPLQAPLAAA